MRTHRSLVVIVLVACLICPFFFSRAAAPDPPIVGTWELVGVGDTDGNVKRPARFRITVDGEGRFRYQVWDDAEEDPFQLSGRWTLAGERLTLVPQDAETLKASTMTFKIAWDGSVLVLHPLEDGSRDSLPMRFAPRSGSPW